MKFDMVLTTCPFCGTGCNFYLKVLEGEITDVVPCKTHPVSEGELCVLGRNAYKFIQNKNRLTKPLIRKGGDFIEVSWSEAYKRVADGLLGIKKNYGPNALAVLSSAKCTNEENYLIMKFARGVLGTNNLDHCARLCHSSTVTGLAASFGAGAMTNSITEIDDADCILVIGSNTTGQHPLIASKIIRAKEKGAKLIVIDPRKIPLTEYADLFIQVKPGTNVAFINGMIHILIEKGLIDEAFIRERTEGFEELKQKVKEYPAERVSEITDISKEVLEKAALLYGQADKAMIFYAMGITQHTTGTDNVKSTANLAMVTGNIGRPSTGVNPLRGQNNVQGACDMGALPNVLTGYKPVSDPNARSLFQEKGNLSLPDTPGLTLVEMMDSAREGSLKGMFVVGENPMMSDPDIKHVKEALEALDLLVVQDIFLTETAKLAHVILPASSFAEKEGTFTNTDRRVQRVRKAIDPIGQSKPDWQIISELASEMGFTGFDFNSPKEIMKEISSVTTPYAGITYKRLDKGEVLHWPCPDENHPGTPFLHGKDFPRGKGRFFALDYVPPPELPDKEYPYILSTGRIPFHFHGGSMTRKIDILNQEAPTGYVDIHPEDAKKLGVAEKELLKVSSRRGEISIKARISTEVKPGIVFIPIHFSECAVNILTDRKFDPVAKIPGFKVCAVNIEKQE
ncbi:MAG: formate dehydrogenase subunit alpha [Deltaproteobacteria bacterium]|nr:formate dehydrogenase subunit alpha [Deltaproteobacteria bacterium]